MPPSAFVLDRKPFSLPAGYQGEHAIFRDFLDELTSL